MRISDWSSDVCSSDLQMALLGEHQSERCHVRAQRIFGLARVLGKIGRYRGVDAPVELVLPIDPGPAILRAHRHMGERSEERRVGKEGVSRRGYRRRPYHSKKKTQTVVIKNQKR